MQCVKDIIDPFLAIVLDNPSDEIFQFNQIFMRFNDNHQASV
jgi:hypothetical protein